MESAKGTASLGIDLERLHALKGTRPVSLSQQAHLELARHLLHGTLSFEAWRTVAPKLDAVLDRDYPIIPGGRGLQAMLGAAVPTVDWRALRAHWALLRDARRAVDISGDRPVFVDGRWEKRRRVDLVAAVDGVGDTWVRLFDGLVEERGSPVAARDRAAAAAEARTALLGAGLPDVPELATVVHLIADYVVLHSKGYAEGRGYKPSRNDGLDLDQLLMLGLPAFLCSSDGRFVRKVNALHTPGSERVLLPEAMLEVLAGSSGG